MFHDIEQKIIDRLKEVLPADVHVATEQELERVEELRQKAPAEMNRAAEELEGVLREEGVTIDPNAQYRGSAARENPNDTVSDDAMDADFEEVDK